MKTPLIKNFDWDFIDLNVYNDDEKMEKLVDTSTIYSELLKYRNRRLTEDFGIAEIQNIFNDVSKHWRDIFNLLKLEYAPLENYNMIESNKELIERDKSYQTNDTNNTLKTSTFDSETLRDNTKTTISTDITNKYDNTLSDSDTGINSNEKHTFINTKKGNLGVTTSQQMLKSEIEIRLIDYVKKFVLYFVDEISYYD